MLIHIAVLLNRPEFRLGEVLLPWSVIIGTLGFFTAWLVATVMECRGLSRYVWHLPLFFLGLVVLFFSLPQALAAPKPDQPDKPNFTGNWTLDLQASSSLDLLMKQMGSGLLDRKYAAWTQLRANLHQTENVLTIAVHGPGFALDETLYLDGRSNPSNLQLLGATSVNTKAAWSKDYKLLVETHQIKTKQGEELQLIIKRYLTNGGKTLVAAYTLQLNTESDQTSAQQIWHKQA